MSSYTGEVGSINVVIVNTKFGAKPTYNVVIDGDTFKCGFKKPTCVVGDVVEVQFSEGKYGKEVIAIVKMGGSSAPVKTNPVPAPTVRRGFPIDPLDSQRSIIRQNAVTNARSILTDFYNHVGDGSVPESLDDYLKAVLSTASKIEAYTAGDADFEAAKADVANMKES